MKVNTAQFGFAVYRLANQTVNW